MALERTRIDKVAAFNPNSVGIHNGKLFGLPFSVEECDVVVIPIPWEATVSYRSGTAFAPYYILQASPQIDYYDPLVPDAWKLGIGMLPISAEWESENAFQREKARAFIKLLEHSVDPNNQSARLLVGGINEVCRRLNHWVYETANEWLNKGKLVCVLGGEHSSPLGLIQALSDRYPGFGVLQIDAHADLRVAYQGFEFSHASIMYNVLQLAQVSRLVQVGVREYCHSEIEYVQQSNGRICFFEDRYIKRQLFEGRSWRDICYEIIECLPQHVYISFDIDGLDPSLCPNTGTPVPGGPTYDQVFYLIELLVSTGRQIIGFDLVEVAVKEENDSWDAIVGARVLYRLGTLCGLSNGRFNP
jgi:agmatinase